MSRTALRPLAGLSRHAQTTSFATRSLATSSATVSDRLTPDDPVKPLPLTWPTYLNARRSRKLWSTVASVPSTFAGLSLGGGYFASIEADPSNLIMGMEPMIVYGGATVGCMALESDVSQYPPPSVHPAFQRKLKASPNDADISALGYLIGPTIGSLLYSLTHPTLSKGNPSPLEVMDRAFFDHIKANRASPAFQSVNNPAPDFYGEKIVSLSTYRRWLRDQAAYTRKAMHGVPEESQ